MNRTTTASSVHDYGRHIAAQGKQADDLSRALISKVAEDDQHARQRAALPVEWQGLFAPQSTPGFFEDREVQMLDQASRKLADKWLKFQSRLPEGHRSKVDGAPPCAQDVLASVEFAMRQKAETKSTKTGRVKSAFASTCSALDTHKSLFAVIPSGDKYLSLLTGSLSSIVTASAMHTKISEEIERAIDGLCDSIKLWARQANIHPRDKHMAPLAARLYTVVFVFLLDIMEEWLASSMKRFLHSFGTGFLDNKLKASRARIAEISTTLEKHGNLTAQEHLMRIPDESMWKSGFFEPILQEFRVKLGEDVANMLATQQISQQRQQQHFINSMMSPDQRLIAPSAIDPLRIVDADTTYEKQQLLAWSSDLHAYRQEAVIDNITQLEWDPSIGLELFPRLEEWYKTPESATLWIVGPFQCPIPSRTTLTAAFMLDVLRRAGMNCLVHFCDLRDAQQMRMLEAERLIALLYSLVAQATSLLPEHLKSSSDFNASRFAQLNGKPDSAEAAIDLLADLLKVGPGALFCIIDSIDALANHEPNRPLVNRLVTLLTSGITREESNVAIVRKTLFSTNGLSDALQSVGVADRFNMRDFGGQPAAGADSGYATRSLAFF